MLTNNVVSFEQLGPDLPFDDVESEALYKMSPFLPLSKSFASTTSISSNTGLVPTTSNSYMSCSNMGLLSFSSSMIISNCKKKKVKCVLIRAPYKRGY